MIFLILFWVHSPNNKGLLDLLSTKGIIPQDKFKGNLKPGPFRAWAYQVKSTIRAKDSDLSALMDTVELPHVVESSLKTTSVGRKTLHDGGQKDALLHSILVNLVEIDSEPFKILQNNDGQGLESWRLFHRRWTKNSKLTT